MDFPASIEAVHERIDFFDPILYARTRNFLLGGVSYLSPYLSRGFITVPEVYQRLLQRGFSFPDMEKFVQELAWREYYTRTWFQLGDGIFDDIRHPQEGVQSKGIPLAVLEARTGIHVIDEQLAQFPQHGYLHNHVRMYLASIMCNVAHYHWSKPAAWMYYHLLDGDLASNALSWQWCAGTFSQKRYFVNQENINYYTGTEQRGTFLDFSYEEIPQMETPKLLKERGDFVSEECPMAFNALHIQEDLPTFIYTHYTIDPHFHRGELGNRILVLEPSHFRRFPVSPKVMQFILDLAFQIPEIQIFYGEYANLGISGIFRDHPINAHFQGKRESYPFLVPELNGQYPSFFAYWNRLKKYLEKV